MTLFSSVVGHLWQSTLFAAMVGMLTLVLRSNHARSRHWLWVAASLKFLVPFSLLIAIGTHLHRSSPGPSHSQFAFAVEEVGSRISAVLPVPALAAVAPASSNRVPSILLIVWACGFLAVSVRWCMNWQRMRAAARAGRSLGRQNEMEVIACPTLVEPGVFGMVRPVLLLPDGIADRLTPAQMQSIVAHELCHVRHRDNLTSALHMIVEALFWFHPLVWWIGTRLVAERERACDEEVLRMGNEPQVYAEGILKVCQFYLESPSACMAGVTGSNLKKRIEEIMTQHVSVKLDFARKVLLVAMGLAAVAGPVAIGLLHAPRTYAQTQSGTAAQPSFEVASIKPSAPGGRGMQMMMAPGGRFTAKNVTIRVLIQQAYNVRDFQISGGPSWLTSEHYDLAAKAEGEEQIKPEQLRLMVRTLLADRCKLVFHRDTKELPIYALVIGKNGPKLQEGQGQGPMLRMGRGTLTAQKVPMELFANNLAMQVGRTVIDKTGLKGEYDFKLEWTPDVSQPPAPRESGEATAPPDPGGPSIFTALQEQLGLKLESQKGPVEILIIDSIEKPSEN